MKKALVVLTTLLLLILTACGNEADEKVLRVGGTGQSFPNAYKEGGKLVGYDVEVIQIIAKRLGYKIEWTVTDFSGLMGQLEAGKLDTVANAVAVTPKRSKVYQFTDPYAFAGTQVVTRKDNNQINSLADLKGKTISAVLGSNHVNNFKAYDKNGSVNIRTYETREGAVNDLLMKRVDGYINSRSILAAEIAKKDLPLKFVGDPVKYESVAFPFAKTPEKTKLVEQINQEIQKMKKDGTLQKLSNKYFHEDVTQKK
jgi:putative amino-acid transport system substrate-binding protein